MLGDSAPTVVLYVSDTFALVEGGAGADSITDSDNLFVTNGFVVGDEITVGGATAAADNVTATVDGVAAGALTLPIGTFTTGEAAGATIAIAAAHGGSLKDALRNGIIKIYSGSQPANADTAASGTHLATITVGSGAFTAGSETNGLEFGTASSGEIEMSSSETWSGVGLNDGTAGWFRFYGNATDAGGAGTTLPRIDGSIGTSGADLNMSSISITTGATYTIDSFKLTLPYQYGA
jgi:hypothetical protein